MFNEFQRLINKIDENIQDKKIYDDPLLLKNTTELLSSANILLSKQKNIHNDYFQNQFLESCFNDLLQRKNKLSDITNQYKNQLMQKKKKMRLDFGEEDYLDDDNYKMFDRDINVNTDNNEYELGFITNLNESLLNGTVKNLNSIQNNIEITSRNLKTQGDKLHNISNKSNTNEENTKTATNFVDSISCNQKCRKFLLMIINILLFITIILVFSSLMLDLFEMLCNLSPCVFKFLEVISTLF
jgi:hypothetical protein